MKPSSRRWLAVVPVFAVVVAVGLVFGSCGGSSIPSTPTPTGTGTATVSPTATPRTPSPVPTTVTATPTATATAFPTPTPTPTAPAGTRWYEVQPGDTMFSLANRFGTTVAALAALNGISDPSVLRAGSFILVPGGSATTTPTATATVTATRTQPPAGASRLVRNGSRSSNAIALTFDMGGRVDPALDIMNWLIANNVKATIFPTGSMVQNRNTDAGRQVLALVAANPGLFELGNHSYSHPDFTTITEAQIREELARTEAAVAAYTTLSMQPRFRPPFGAYDARVLSAVGAAGYAQTLMWDVDTIDWRPEADGGPTAASMAAKVVNNAQGGTIVLMHLGGYNTLGALPAMVQGLRDRGFQFVRVSELPLD